MVKSTHHLRVIVRNYLREIKFDQFFLLLRQVRNHFSSLILRSNIAVRNPSSSRFLTNGKWTLVNSCYNPQLAKFNWIRNIKIERKKKKNSKKCLECFVTSGFHWDSKSCQTRLIITICIIFACYNRYWKITSPDRQFSKTTRWSLINRTT